MNGVSQEYDWQDLACEDITATYPVSFICQKRNMDVQTTTQITTNTPTATTTTMEMTTTTTGTTTGTTATGTTTTGPSKQPNEQISTYY